MHIKLMQKFSPTVDDKWSLLVDIQIEIDFINSKFSLGIIQGFSILRLMSSVTYYVLYKELPMKFMTGSGHHQPWA